MELFFQDILSFLLLYKYTALFLVTFLAAFALPLPSSTSLMTAAGFASQGYLNIWLVILFAVLGNFLADNISFLIARNSDHLLRNQRHFKKITSSRLYHVLEARFERHTTLIVFLSRFEVVCTITVNVLTGFMKMDYRKFFFAGLAGETAQVCIFAGIGYFFGSNWEDSIASLGESAFFFIPITIILLYALRRHLARVLAPKIAA